MCYLTVLVLIAISISSSDSCMRVRPTDPGMPANLCKRCATIPIVDGPNKINFANDAPDDTGPCLKRTFTCSSNLDPAIVVDQGAGAGELQVGDLLDGVMDGTIQLVATCKDDGTGWTSTVQGFTLNIASVYCTGF